MTLSCKMIILVSFMLCVTLVVLAWCYNRLSPQLNHFKEIRESEKQKILTQKNESLQKLNMKAQHMGEDVSSFLGGMEESIKQKQKEHEEFVEGFMKKQNNVFDAIDAFAGEK